jgi:ABC-type transport system involved in multi-copper enzyme maturation permease subunit
MNKLIWKELREMRMIPVAVPLLAALLFLVYDAVLAWMAAHGSGTSAWMTPNDCTWFLILGAAASGIFAGSSAVAPETGSGTLMFLTSLPISRPRLWTAKLVAGFIITVASVITVVLAFLPIAYCLLPIKIIFDPNTAYFITLITAYVYCVALLASTLVDRSITAAVIAVIASVTAGIGFVGLLSGFSALDQHDPHGLQAMYVAGASIYLGLLITSFLAFCRGGSLRTSRRWVIASVTLLAWFVGGGLCFAAYGDYYAQRWDSDNYRVGLLQSQQAIASYSSGSMTIVAPTLHGQRWLILMDHALIGKTRYASIDLESNDLDTPSAIPIRAEGDRAVRASIGGVVNLSRDYYRGSIGTTVISPAGPHFAVGHPFPAGPIAVRVNIAYTPQAPAGDEHQTVRLYDQEGRVVGAVDIVGSKSMTPTMRNSLSTAPINHLIWTELVRSAQTPK